MRAGAMRYGAVVVLAVACMGFAAPQQPWRSPDGLVRLLRPLIAAPTTSDAPLGSLMSPGWRLVWDGSPPTRGRIIVRFVLPVVPRDGVGTAREVLQLGVGRTAADVRSCRTRGLAGPSGKPAAPRTINGVRYTAWTNGDAGMSQHIAATDLRAVVGGACYAVERFAYGISAEDRDPTVTLTQADGAAMLNAALASLHIGPPGAPPLTAPALHVPPGTVAR